MLPPVMIELGISQVWYDTLLSGLTWQTSNGLRIILLFMSVRISPICHKINSQ